MATPPIENITLSWIPGTGVDFGSSPGQVWLSGNAYLGYGMSLASIVSWSNTTIVIATPAFVTGIAGILTAAGVLQGCDDYPCAINDGAMEGGSDIEAIPPVSATLLSPYCDP
jgi:hypothetical protein